MKRLIAGIVALGAVLAVAGSGLAATSHSATIKEKEFRLVPSKVTVAHGKVTLTLKNVGKFAHALSIEDGLSEHRDAKSKIVQAGKTVKFTVSNLKKGRYEIYCPIDGHKSKGMEGTLIVK